MRELRESRGAKRPSRAKAATNVLREGLHLERVPDPSVLVLFGATGDLAYRKVIPAMYHLWRTNLLPHEFLLLAVGRRAYHDDDYRAEVRTALEQYSRVLPLDDAAWSSFSERIMYDKCDFTDPSGFDRLESAVLTSSTRSTTRAATGCSTSPPSRRTSRTSSHSWAAWASTTSTMTVAGAGS